MSYDRRQNQFMLPLANATSTKQWRWASANKAPQHLNATSVQEKQGGSLGRADWETRFEELAAYGERHGYVNVPQSVKDPENKSLAFWVVSQRRKYKHRMEGKSSTMTDERIQKLER